tara:strand:- start:72 stop:749 length:678 start_codon:yes stop_codon:yes gene_type:complete
MKKIISTLGASFIWMALIAPANSGPVGVGVALQVGQYETSGTETEKAVTGVTSETTNKTLKETFAGASVYAEYRRDNGFALGVDYVPTDISLGSGKRTDASTGADVTSEADTGDRSASADIDGLTTIYAHIPIGPVYVLLGYHSADVTTTETLQTSSYGNVSINGTQIGLGIKSEDSRMRAQVSYSDFDDISLTATGNTIAGNLTGQNKITADADVLAFSVAFGF